jgi:hypothetical protein
VRLVVEADRGVHLPLPGVLQRHRDRLAPAVLLPGEDRLRPPAVVAAGEQHRSARFGLQRRVDGADRGQFAPPCRGRGLGVRHLRDGVPLARARRLDLHPRETLRFRRARLRIDGERQRIGDRRAAVPAFTERPRAAEHQQAAAAAVHEVGDHLQLIAGEGASLDAAENQRPIRKQLLACLRKSALELLGVVDADAHELVVRGALQRHHLEVLVLGDRAADELHLEPRLSLEVENLLLAVPHLDQRLAHVVLRNDLVGLLLDAELEQPRAGVGHRRADTRRGRAAVGRQLHLL